MAWWAHERELWPIELTNDEFRNIFFRVSDGFRYMFPFLSPSFAHIFHRFPYFPIGFYTYSIPLFKQLGIEMIGPSLTLDFNITWWNPSHFKIFQHINTWLDYILYMTIWLYDTICIYILYTAYIYDVFLYSAFCISCLFSGRYPMDQPLFEPGPSSATTLVISIGGHTQCPGPRNAGKSWDYWQ